DSSMKDHRGTIPARNTGRAPWTNQTDFRVVFGIPIQKQKLEVGLDIVNVGNLINKKWGQVQYANFNDVAPLALKSVDAATGKMIYDITALKAPTFQKFNRDDLRSRWQAQLSARIRF